MGGELVLVEQRRVQLAAVQHHRRDALADLHQQVVGSTARIPAGGDQIGKDGALAGGDGDIHDDILPGCGRGPRSGGRSATKKKRPGALLAPGSYSCSAAAGLRPRRIEAS